MTFTDADLEALKEALVSGATEVQIGDRRVRYNSIDEIIKVISLVEKSIASATTTTQNVFPATFNKGKK